MIATETAVAWGSWSDAFLATCIGFLVSCVLAMVVALGALLFGSTKRQCIQWAYLTMVGVTVVVFLFYMLMWAYPPGSP